MKSEDLGRTGDDLEDSSRINNDFFDDDSSSFVDHVEEKKQLPEIAKKETVAVNRLKILVLITLSIPTATIACAIYYYVKRVEEKEFESAYYDDAEKIVKNFGMNLDVLLEATESLAVATVSYADSTNQKWPFVTLPDFASRTSTIRNLAKTVWIAEYCMVPAELRVKWEAYSKANNRWVNEGIAYQKTDKRWKGPIIWNYTNFNVIHDYGEYEKPPEEQGTVGSNYTKEVYFPLWENSPIVPYYAPYNWDLGSITDSEFLFRSLVSNTALITYPYLGAVYKDPEDEAEIEEMGHEAAWIADYIDPKDAERADEPVADLIYPIITNTDGSNVKDGIYSPSPHITSVGIYSITYHWRELLRDILPENSIGIHVVFDSCRPSFTYQVNGADTEYLGPQDFHQKKYDAFEVSSNLLDLTSTTYMGVPVDAQSCPYNFRVYPSDTFRAQYHSSDPVVITVSGVVIFALLNTLVFLVYDRLVQHRNRIVVNKANRTRKIVSDLFPAIVQKQLFGDENDSAEEKQGRQFIFISPKDRLSTFLAESPGNGKRSEAELKVAKPIAEVFTDTTVMFADIVGFTAWSSVREPFQVFTLLETVYGAFDKVAKRMGVFKVETIGDAYVAASGVPEPRENHALVMAKFAAKCRSEMNRVTQELEVSLGPKTGDLRMRFGLHSGSVTAGVLRGDKARFQLFGHTVNTAARMESTGVGNLIQISKKTADLIIAAGFQNWIMIRADLVEAKDIGTVQTYFVEPRRGAATSRASSVNDGDQHIAHFEMHEVDEKLDRLVIWMVEVLGSLLKSIHKHRGSNRRVDRSYKLSKGTDESTMVRDEVQEIIELPEFKDSNELLGDDNEELELDAEVAAELREYITQIALKYNDNPFHNFEHACQVTMATRKLLSRIVAPNDVEINEKKDLYDTTYGIASDPLTQFAVVFSSLIHDVDHPGVSNQQLVVEETAIAKYYDGKSVSEQHSLDLAWDMLMEPTYSKLREAIFSNEVEFNCFRQLIVNSVMATDIFDKELKAIRDGRWDKAFDEETKQIEESKRTFANRRATIVIEHIIQASDIAHCMQHWKVYQKWNKQLFLEMYAAFRAGRLAKNPADSWYGGELWFFDYYIIPLAKKLKTCGVFGVSCDEFLDCAVDNRNEWADRGKEITALFLKEIKEQEDFSCFEEEYDKITDSPEN